MKLRHFYTKYRHFILYAVFGTISTGLEFGVYALLCRHIPYLWANVIGFHCGLICSFLLNRSINFKKEDRAVLRFAAFYLVQIICLSLNSLILYLCVDVWHWNTIVSKGFSILMTALLPFILNKRITFGTPLNSKV